MDYFGWELERQRAALRALLLGGGEIRDGGVPSETRRSPADRERAAVESPPDSDPGSGEIREAARRARQGRLTEGGGALPAPASAWERISGREAADPGREAEDSAQASPGTPRDMAIPQAARRGGAGRLQAKGSGAERPGTGAPGQPAGGTETADSRESSAWGYGGGEAAETNPAAARRAESGTVWAWRRSGGAWYGALRAEDGAKALSQAVQRDARRYDGGFIIY